MQCTKCQVFLGTPVCGACKAAQRIQGILSSQVLRVSQEKAVLDILRGAAGALSDLVEEGQQAAKGEAKGLPADQGGDARPNPRAAKKEESSKGAKDEHSDYSYETYSEGHREEAPAEDEPCWDRSPSVDPEEKQRKSKPSTKPRVAPDVDPHYLSNALQLKAAPKQSSKDRETLGRYQQHGDTKRPREADRHHGDEGREPRGPGGGGSAQPLTPEREPIQRKEKFTGQKKRKRGSGGKKKKERGRQFKEPAAAVGRLRRGLLRPAGRANVEAPTAWERGEVLPLIRVSLDDLKPGLLLVSEEAEYFGAKTKVAATILKVEIDGEDRYLSVKPTGTDSEGILKVFTADPSMPFKVHLCPTTCDRMETGDRIIHMARGRRSDHLGEPAWVTSLERVAAPAGGRDDVDQLLALRERSEAMGTGPAPSGHQGRVPAGSDLKESEDKKTKKKKKKKEKKEEDPILSGRKPSRAAGHEEGQELCLQEEVQRGKLQFIRELKQQQLPRPTADGKRGSFPRRVEDEGAGRALPRRPIDGRISIDAESFANNKWRRAPGCQPPSDRHVVLPQRVGQEDFRGGGKGIAESMHMHRRPSSWATCGSTRRATTAGQSPGSCSTRCVVDGRTADGNPLQRGGDPGGERRDGRRQEDDIPGGQDELAVTEAEWRRTEGRRQEQRQVAQRQGRTRQGRQEAGPERQGEGQREEVTAVPGLEALGIGGSTVDVLPLEVKKVKPKESDASVPIVAALEPQRVVEVARTGLVAPGGAGLDVHPKSPTSGRAFGGSAPLLESNNLQPEGWLPGVVNRQTVAAREEKERAVKASGAMPKHHTPGIPLEGPMSLSAFTSSSPFLQRPKWPIHPSGTGPSPAGLPHAKTEVAAAGEVVSSADASSVEAGKKSDPLGVGGVSLHGLGCKVFQLLLEVVPLRSQPMGNVSEGSLFPLPTSRGLLLECLPSLAIDDIPWMLAVCVGLNSFYGCDIFSERPVNKCQALCLHRLSLDVLRLKDLEGRLETFDWQEFFTTRGIDYKGDEVKTARSFTWANISPALPQEIGKVPLAEVCTLGARHYVEHFDLYLKDPETCVLPRAPRVMVPDESWGEVCHGLVSCGLCTYLTRDQVFSVGGRPLLNGLFGVTKDEWHQGHEVFRLIMNMIPLNTLAQPLAGDVETLPMWSLMSPYFIQPDEHLLVSSEDVRCFFYTMSVPAAWHKYLAFNKAVPSEVLPPMLRDQEVFLAATVLPMGFLNSVSLAQHVRRNLALWSGELSDDVNYPEAEIRKDRPVTVCNPSWRIYLDNYDLLEKVKAVDATSLHGSEAPAVLALRQQYQRWEVPRNLKKSVVRAPLAEVQGAQVDGQLGVAYPRESKLLKYVSASLQLVAKGRCSQKEAQVIGGGLVYVSMFRRPLLGSLNALWRFIGGFAHPSHVHPIPTECKLEIIRFVSLIPLAKLDFRLDYRPQVTCSDASTSGGGICRSNGLTRYGSMAACGKLRGELPELRSDHRTLSIGLFDGIGALRVALDLIGASVIGHISVEKEATAQRVVEAHFPETRCVADITLVDDEMIAGWARDFSQASLVVIGAGPPCQGVSGLNASRRGALRDERSVLYKHVERIWSNVSRRFSWCQVHCLQESVASMDDLDRSAMSEGFGEQPYSCDAGTMTWANRPRLYWLSWDVFEQDGVDITPRSSTHPGRIVLTAQQDLEEVCLEGWLKVDPNVSFPTFTTSRPRSSPGYKPAGLHQCGPETVQRWQEDQHRYPPYQYRPPNLLINKHNEMRMPAILEKEYIMGFPANYTASCFPKGRRNTVEHLDRRHSLIGNTWSVPVVSWLLSQLFKQLGLGPGFTPQQLVDMLNPAGQVFLQSRLLRQPLRPLRGEAPVADTNLVRKLGNLVSIKGEDILLTTPSSQLCKFHRLRASVPSKLWRWAVVAGWTWRGSPEHINGLELRATLTSVRWRIEHRLQVGCRFLHLVDSLVVLHALSRGRTSSRKLRRSLSRINALLLCSGCQALWGYVHTDQNPADKPSRWGRKVRTKFRNAK
eukprot:Skav202700  [mRNA]  locus=scaffold654:350470:356680:- [translate_table: standard]